MRETADHYRALVQTWLPIQEIELKPLAVPEKSAATRKQIQEKEGALLLQQFSKLLSSRRKLYLLDEGGKNLTTLQWAQMAREWEASSTPDIVLCVGSSLGFADAIRKSAQGILSLGAQTFPHELARVVLYEQLYRAWSVTRNHPYHNEGS